MELIRASPIHHTKIGPKIRPGIIFRLFTVYTEARANSSQVAANMAIARSIMVSVFVVLIEFAIFSGSVQASGLDKLIVDAPLVGAPVNSHVYYLEDSQGVLGYREVLYAEPKRWNSMPETGANFGFSESAYWFSLELENGAESLVQMYLEVDYAVLDLIDYFEIQNQAVVKQVQLGDTKRFEDRLVAYPTFLFPFELEAGASKRILLRVQTEGAVQVPFNLWEQSAFWQTQQGYQSSYGIFIGILLVMLIYNLFLYVSVRDWSYLFYCLFTVGVLGFDISIDGWAYQWLWPDLPGWHQFSVLVFNALGCIGLVLFALFYLAPEQHSKVRRSLVLTSGLAILAGLSVGLFPYHIAAIIQSVANVIAISVTAICGLILLRQGRKEPIYFLVAWSAFLIGTMLRTMSKVGLLPYNIYFEYAGMAGAVIGVVVLSLALADKLRMERSDKERAQQLAIGNLRKYFSLYKNAREGIFVLNMEGKILSANPAMLAVLSIGSLGELRSRTPGQAKVGLNDQDFDSLLAQLRQQGEVINHEVRLCNAEGERFWVSVTARITVEDDGDQSLERIEGTLIDIQDRKAFEDELQHLASHDPLTGFMNRYAFEKSATALLQSVQSSNSIAVMLYLDLDQFKLVNDLCGHTAGDNLLRSLSYRLQNYMKRFQQELVIARLGGDEFGILLQGFDVPRARKVAEDLRQNIETFVFVWDGHRYPIGVSIGMVEITASHQTLEQLMVMADTACYMAKDQGRNRVHLYSESDQDIQFRKREMEWLSTLRAAMEQDHFHLVAQSIVPNVEQVDQLRYEILLRLHSRKGELISPRQFLPAAERYRLMPSIDRWVIRHYFSWLKANPAHVEALDSASINLSTQSIGEEPFTQFLKDAFKEYGIPPAKICFEITESMAITHLDNTEGFIRELKQMGCKFALDDFGTGFSSYAYLRDLDIDYIKIDGMFVRNLANNQIDEAMVRSVNEVASTMNIETIAEFVENQAIQEKLVDLGIHYSQGYFIQKPIPLEELEERYREQRFQHGA